MKNMIKYWLLAASAIMAMPVLTSCDDDDEPTVQLPTDFNMETVSLNITWDETEGYVQFAANGEWKATPLSGWIKVDPNSGDAGDCRAYLLFEPNPYRLPRTGQVEVTCGDKTGLVEVIQAGCTDDSQVAPCVSDISIDSFDYQTGEIAVSDFAEAIMGNLGLSVADFAKGVGAEGNLDFFVVGKDGQWLQGGTSGTRCGAWFDSNLNVAQWDGAGYPRIALFLEVYGDDDNPRFVIGRAPGVPDNAEYTLNFGFTFANDHSKYCMFKVNVVFPAVSLEGEILETIDMDINIPSVGYDAVKVPFDSQKVMSTLGCTSMAITKVVSYDADGKFLDYTGNNGYWYDKTGAVGTWGDTAGWFIEFHGDSEEAEPEDLTSFAVGTMPGVANVSGNSSIGFFYNGKVVMFNVHMTVGDAPEAPAE